jgi:hypothetical protein
MRPRRLSAGRSEVAVGAVIGELPARANDDQSVAALVFPCVVVERPLGSQTPAGGFDENGAVVEEGDARHRSPEQAVDSCETVWGDIQGFDAAGGFAFAREREGRIDDELATSNRGVSSVSRTAASKATRDTRPSANRISCSASAPT